MGYQNGHSGCVRLIDNLFCPTPLFCMERDYIFYKMGYSQKQGQLETVFGLIGLKKRRERANI